MSQFTVNKSLATDFGGTWNQGQIHREVKANGTLTSIYLGVNYTDGSDVIVFVFNANPDSTQLTALSSVISAHVPVFPKDKKIVFTVAPIDRKITFPAYTLVARFSYGGTTKSGAIDYIQIMSRLNASTEQYSVKVINVANLSTIAEKTGINNTDYNFQDLGTISNVPADPCILEVYVKKTGTDEANIVQIDEIKVYHNNVVAP